MSGVKQEPVLVASVAAFGVGTAGIAQVGAVYLGASLIAASPTPDGLGPVEAASVASLTGIGIASGPAVSAVLVYRLATYWLPILPGCYSSRQLQRMDYI